MSVKDNMEVIKTDDVKQFVLQRVSAELRESRQ